MTLPDDKVINCGHRIKRAVLAALFFNGGGTGGSNNLHKWESFSITAERV